MTRYEMECIIHSKRYRFNKFEKVGFLLNKLENSTLTATQAAIYLLDFIEKRERIYNKSWLYFSKNEVIDSLASIKARKFDTISSYISSIKGYLLFITRDHDRSVYPGYIVMRDPELRQNNRIMTKDKSRVALYPRISDIHKLLNATDNDTMKCIIMAIFSGVRPNNNGDLMNLKLSDLDEDQGIIYIKRLNKHILVDEELLDGFEKYVGILKHRYSNVDGDIYLLRTVTASTGRLDILPSYTSISKIFTNFAKELNIILTPKGIHCAGIYHAVLMDFNNKLPDEKTYQKYCKENIIEGCTYKYLLEIKKSIRYNNGRLKRLK